MARRQIAQACPAGLERRNRQTVPVNVHQRTGQATVAQNRPRAGVARVLDGRRGITEQVRHAAQQILNARTHHDLLRRTLHTAIIREVVRDLAPQVSVTLHLAALQKLRPLVEQLLLNASPAARREQRRVHTARGKLKQRGGFAHRLRGGRYNSLRGRARRAGMQHAVGFLHVKTAAGARFGQALGCQHLVGCVHGVYAHALLGGHGAPPRQRRAGGAVAAAYLVRQGGVQLLIQWCF